MRRSSYQAAELEYEPNGPPTVCSFTLTEKRKLEERGVAGAERRKKGSWERTQKGRDASEGSRLPRGRPLGDRGQPFA